MMLVCSEITQTDAELTYSDCQPFISADSADRQYMKTFAAEWAKLKASTAQVIDKAVNKDTAGMLGLYRGEDRANFDAAIQTILTDLDFNAAEGKKAADAGAAT